jgi:hypothetical protein
MQSARCVASILAIVLSVPQAAWAKTEVLTLKWSELSPTVANREVTVLVPGNVRVRGTVTEVQPDALVMTIRKTSDKKAYPKGEASIPRAEVHEIRIKQVRGPARLIGAAGAGTAAALGSFGWSISDSRVNVSDATRGAQWAAITAGATVGGYLIGRLIDTKETIIKVAPEN